MSIQRSTWRNAAKSWLKAARGVTRGLYDAVAATAFAMGWPNGGGYQVLDPNRKIINGLTRMLAQYSANELANLSLAQIRALCRKLDRDNATARAAVEGSCADVIGTGIDLDPDHGDEAINARIRPFWQAYKMGCDITGTRSIFDLQGEAFRGWFLAGEHVWRYVVLSELADLGGVPLRVLPLDSEWIADQLPAEKQDAITRVNGIDVDKWGRPLAYWLRNPESCVGDHMAERVPAKDINHGFQRRRALQNRGEPWLAPVIERIHQEGDLIDTELKAAINCSGIAVVVTSEMHSPLDDGTIEGQATDGSAYDPAQGIGVGSIARVRPGEDVKAFMHNRPGQQIEGFSRMLRGSVAAAAGVSARWLDRDPKRANYSSMRADQQDSERLLSPVKETFGHQTIGALYLRVLPYLCAMAGIPVPKRKAYRLLPDGMPYVNPRDDIQAISMAVAAGFTDWETEMAKRGKDYREVWRRLAAQKKEAAALGLSFDLSGTNAPAPESQVGADPETDPENSANTILPPNADS